MATIKRHLIKNFQNKLKGHTRIIILGPLDIDKSQLRKKIKLQSPTLIILVDGGTHHRGKLSLAQQNISLSVGDGDSFSFNQSLDILLPTNKNCSDLAFVIESIIKSKIKFDEIALYGFSSLHHERRLDHLLFTIGILGKCAEKLSLKIELDERFLILPPGENAFTYQGIFSVIALKATLLKIEGKVSYPLKKWTRMDALNSRGLSNEAHGKVAIKTNKALVVYLTGISCSS